MAGNPADLTVYKDENATHDHTYYGRGCPNEWGTDGKDGSQTPCADSDAGGRYVTTADGETQKNGTYYHFQAATSGSGSALDEDNTNSPDTFCPLGWQLPYSGTGGDYYNKSKSWNYLFTTYSITFNNGTATDATKIKSYPFSYVHSGRYVWYTGRLYLLSNNGIYWSSTISGSIHSYDMTIWPSETRITDSSIKKNGMSVRCVPRTLAS